jgi:hypothetical protein
LLYFRCFNSEQVVPAWNRRERALGRLAAGVSAGRVGFVQVIVLKPEARGGRRSYFARRQMLYQPLPTVSKDEILPSQSVDLVKLIDVFVRALEASEAEERLERSAEWEARKKARR